MKKLIFGLIALCMASPAFAICTTVSVPANNTSTLVLAALDQGSAGRKLFIFGGTSSCPAWCDIGTAAAPFSGFLVGPGENAPFMWIPPVQQDAKTFPIVPSGAVNCAVAANMGCQAQTVSACDW